MCIAGGKAQLEAWRAAQELEKPEQIFLRLLQLERWCSREVYQWSPARACQACKVPVPGMHPRVIFFVNVHCKSMLVPQNNGVLLESPSKLRAAFVLTFTLRCDCLAQCRRSFLAAMHCRLHTLSVPGFSPHGSLVGLHVHMPALAMEWPGAHQENTNELAWFWPCEPRMPPHFAGAPPACIPHVLPPVVCHSSCPMKAEATPHPAPPLCL